MQEQVRSFIAIELPETLKEELTRLQARLKARTGGAVRWVDPKSIHITLVFLGNVAADQLGGVTSAIKEASAGIAPFRLQVEGLGVFPNPRRVRIIWVGLTGQLDPLRTLRKRIEGNLKPLGFQPEDREFAPHLTLGRIRDDASAAEREAAGSLVSGLSFQAAAPVEVTSVSLMRSELTRSGAVYSRLSAVPLA